MNRIHLNRGVNLIILSIFALLATPGLGQAGYAGTWTTYENISRTPTASTYPTAVADQAGNLHVFWVEDVGGSTRAYVNNPDGTPVLDLRGKQLNMLTNAGNTLYYTRWNGTQWQQAVDIITVKQGHIYFPSSAVDPKGTLHLVWTQGDSQETELRYSQARADEAGNVSAWSSPITIASPIVNYYYPVAITADNAGGVEVAYYQSGQAPGLYVANSTDGGNNWSDPVQIYANFSENGSDDGSMPVRMLADQKGRIHLTWSRYDTSGNGKAIYYSQSTDHGKTWTKPFEASYWRPGFYETDWLSVGVVGDQIFLNWEGGPLAYCNERVSDDGGKTWSEERRIFPNLVGENGWADLVTDNDGHFYQVVTKRITGVETTVYGVWYSQLLDGQWDVPRLVDPGNYDFYSNINSLTVADMREMLNKTINGDGLRYQRAVIVNGNELFVVVVNEHDGDIYASHIQLDAKRIDPKPYPTLPPATPSAVLEPASITATVQPIATIPTFAQEPPRDSMSPGTVVLIGMAPIAVMILGLVVYRHFKPR